MEIENQTEKLQELTTQLTDASQTVIESNEEEESIHSNEGIKNKTYRRRKKALHSAIRHQMEFYFSDANVSKDRFMQNAIKDGPGEILIFFRFLWGIKNKLNLLTEVPLQVFMNFNKLRSICDDVKEVVKALKYSTILKLSNDETKVSRIIPFCQQPQEEIDQCTIYVVSWDEILSSNIWDWIQASFFNNFQENLPPNATIEWMTQVFSKKFGSVAYVSLPKFKDGSRIKGFAFVEFCLPESAAKAVEVILVISYI